MSRTIQTVVTLILWSEICIFIIPRSGHCELYADHSAVTSNESVCLHTDNTIMTGGLQYQLYKVATGNVLQSYTRGCRAPRRPPSRARRSARNTAFTGTGAQHRQLGVTVNQHKPTDLSLASFFQSPI